MSAKINNTYGAGYYMSHDMDMRAFEEKSKKEQRQGERGKRGRDADAPGEVKKQTWMLPFTFICNNCGRRCSKGSKLYAKIRKLGKSEWQVGGRIEVHELRIRCIFCPNKIVLRTDPENNDYAIMEGAERIKGDWKEQQDKDKEKEAEKAKLLSNDQARHEDMLLRAQRNAEEGEKLQKFIAGRKTGDLHKKTDKLLKMMMQKDATATGVAPTETPAAVENGGGLPTFDTADLFDPIISGVGEPEKDAEVGDEQDNDEDEDDDDYGVADDGDDVFTFDWELPTAQSAQGASSSFPRAVLGVDDHHLKQRNPQDESNNENERKAEEDVAVINTDVNFDESDPFADSDEEEKNTIPAKKPSAPAGGPSKPRSGGALSRLLC